MFSKNELIAIEKGYSVNKNGTILNKNRKLVKGSIVNGYYQITVRHENRFLKIKISRIQAYKKFENKIYEKGIMVRHLDGNSLNDSWDNIDIGTNQDNMLDIPKDKRSLRSKNSNVKYSDELVLEIKQYRHEGHTYKEIMEKYDISSKGTLSNIINKR